MRRVLIGLLVGLAVVTVGTLAAVAFCVPRPSRTCQVVRHWAEDSRAGGALYHPMALAWGGEALYVAIPERGAVQRYAPDGILRSTWTGLGRPVAVAAAESVVYVADFLGDRVVALDADGRLVRVWGRHGAAAGEFDAPSGIAVAPAGTVYVTDLYNHRVQAFTADGRFLREWGGKGRLSGAFHFPTGVVVAPGGDVLVADGFNHRVQRFTADGRYLRKWGGIRYGVAGSWPGWFALAKDVTTDRAGTVYVTDAFNGRVQSFTAEGKLLAVWGGDPAARRLVRYASGIAAAPDGHVYVSDFYGNEIWELLCG